MKPASERETTNRPVRATAKTPTSPRARPIDGSAQTVRTLVCTGPQMRPNKSADGSVAERVTRDDLDLNAVPLLTPSGLLMEGVCAATLKSALHSLP